MKGEGGGGNSGKWVEECDGEAGRKSLTGSGWGKGSERQPERNLVAAEHLRWQREEETGRSRGPRGDLQARVE